MRGRSWIFRLFDTNSSATLVMHRAMKGAVVGSEGGVEVEGGVCVCGSSD